MKSEELVAEARNLVSELVSMEREYQTAAYGSEWEVLQQSHADVAGYWRHKLSILMEEVGEACKDANDEKWAYCYAEMVQATAVSHAITEGLRIYLQNKKLRT